MEDFTLPVFNIEAGDVSDEDVIPPNPAADERAVAWRPHNVLVNLASRSLRLPRSTLFVERSIQITAEECLIRKDLEELNCTLPGNPRSTFLMAFSPDGTKIASTHGDHNINVTDLRTGKCVRSLVGHPRTPWCLAFHPHHNDILASGCLGGQVRVWDLHGGSEVWSVTLNEATSVIASLSFHPTERLLVIATNNSVYFWDWNLPQPFAKCNTASEREKLRYVRFEPTGQWLITGIANAPGSSLYAHRAAAAAPAAASTFGMSMHVQAEQERERNLQSRYQTLLDQYERLRRRYQELRHRAAELEYHANNSSPSSTSTAASGVEEPPATDAADPPAAEADAAESEANASNSSTDVFWRTLMHAAQNLRALSSIGRGFTPSRLLSSEASTSREPPPFDRDARMRIRMMSRHIENMQRICRVYLEVTQHRRQVYRLQQIRRILEDLQEQIRYLHVCVRDSLDLMTQSRPASSPSAASSSAAAAAAAPDAPVPSTSTQHPVGLDAQSFPAAEAASVDLDNAAVERAVDAASSSLFSRRRTSDFLRSPAEPQRFSLRRSQTTDPADDEPFAESESGNLDRSGTFASSYSRWRRLRFSRFSQRLGAVHGSGVSNNPAQQRRRITRAFLDQPNPNEDLVNATQEESHRLTSAQHSLRPLMERLESHFRLQRQTMGVLSDLSGQGSRPGEPEGSDAAPSDANNNQSSPNWSGEMFQEIRDGRNRESSDRLRSLSASRVSPYQRSFLRFRSSGRGTAAAGSSTGTESASRNPLLLVSDDSSDTDNDVAANPAESQNDPPNAVGGSSGTVVRRMRLLWNEYLSQVVLPRRVLNYNVDESSRERRQYRLWLSMMVDSLTSFFSQHGIHAEQNQSDNSATNPPSQERPAEQESRPFPMWRGFQRGAAADPPTHRWDLRRNAESQVSLAAHLSISHRIQAWNFSRGDVPDISDARANIVVAESRIHNDASVDISSSGLFLAALLPSDSPMGALISLHSLEAARLGACLAQVSVAQCVVSVSLSPTNTHLLLGLATSRALSVGLMRDHAAPVLWAQVYKIPAANRIRSEQERKLQEEKVPVAALLEHVRDIGQQGDPSPISLNCMRWIPVAGQGFALGTNKGHLKLLR